MDGSNWTPHPEREQTVVVMVGKGIEKEELVYVC